MKKTIEDYDLMGKKVIIRVDFNVPIKDGKVVDDHRMVESLKTISYAILKKAKVILLSHLGRIKEESDLEKYDMEVVANHLSTLLDQKVHFVKETRGENLENVILNMQNGDVVLVQNTRYEDLNGKKESGNDSVLGKYWASLGDIFINDAFGTSHRAHASNVGIAAYLPSGIGFLIQKELEILTPAIEKPKRPFTVILGGAKVSDKIGVLKSLTEKADYILIAGAMAYTFLQACEIQTGSSLVDFEQISFVKDLMTKYSDKIILPIDHVVTKQIKEEGSFRTCFINEIKEDEFGVDIGSATIKLFQQYLKDSKQVLWNGPVGIFEIEAFSNGTKKLLEICKNLSGDVILGGGDSAASAIKFGYENAFLHISTGGGATLELLEGKKLPGIESIYEKEN